MFDKVIFSSSDNVDPKYSQVDIAFEGIDDLLRCRAQSRDGEKVLSDCQTELDEEAVTLLQTYLKSRRSIDRAIVGVDGGKLEFVGPYPDCGSVMLTVVRADHVAEVSVEITAANAAVLEKFLVRHRIACGRTAPVRPAFGL